MTELTSLIVVQETPSDGAGNFTLGEGSNDGLDGEDGEHGPFGGRTGVPAPSPPPPPRPPPPPSPPPGPLPGPNAPGPNGGGGQRGPPGPDDEDGLFQGANYSPPLQSVDHLLVIGATLLHAIMLLY